MNKELLKLLKNKNALKFLKSSPLELVSAKFLKSLDAEFDRFSYTKKHSYDTKIAGLSIDVYSKTTPKSFTFKKDNKQCEIYIDDYNEYNYTFVFGKLAFSVYLLNNKKFISIRTNTLSNSFAKCYYMSLKEFKELIYLANNPSLLNFL